jgi:hypothetical protein
LPSRCTYRAAAIVDEFSEKIIEEWKVFTRAALKERDEDLRCGRRFIVERMPRVLNGQSMEPRIVLQLIHHEIHAHASFRRRVHLRNRGDRV